MKPENIADKKMRAPQYYLGQEVLYYKAGVGLTKVVVRTVIPGDFVNAYDVVYGDKTVRATESELYETYKDAIRKTCQLLRQDAANKEKLYRSLSVAYQHQQELYTGIAQCLKAEDEEYVQAANECLRMLGEVLEHQDMKSLAELHEQLTKIQTDDYERKQAARKKWETYWKEMKESEKTSSDEENRKEETL